MDEEYGIVVPELSGHLVCFFGTVGPLKMVQYLRLLWYSG